MILTIKTKNRQEIIDITNKVNDFVKESKIKNGLCNIYVRHSSAALTINENADPNMKKDILNTLNKLIPENNKYLHNDICDRSNATGHIKSSLLAFSLTIPFQDNKLQIGQWQGIFLVEFDGSREREVILSIVKTE